jgi:NADH-quinone oxidoreductase subunit L
MLKSLYQLFSIQTVSWLIVLLPLLGAAINGLIAVVTARREIGSYRPVVSFIGVITPTLSFVATMIIFITLISFTEGDPSYITGPLFRWAVTSGLMVDVGLKIDQLSIVMALMVSGVGCLIHLYSVGYMQHDEGYARYFAELNLFVFFMLLLVLADNLVLMFVGWEGVGLCSYLLIGFWFADQLKAQAALKAFIVNRLGDACFLAGMFLIFGIARTKGRLPTHTLLLTGVIFNAFCFALILFVNSVVTMEQAYQIIFLLIGNLESISYQTLGIVAFFVLGGFFLLVFLAGRMNVLSLGDEQAKQLGLNTYQFRLAIFFASSLMVGATVAVAGLIGFVGLFIPHVVRLLFGSDHRLLIPASGLVGASFLVFSDTVARSILINSSIQTELPVGVITALIGAPCFVLLLKRQQKRI